MMGAADISGIGGIFVQNQTAGISGDSAAKEITTAFSDVMNQLTFMTDDLSVHADTDCAASKVLVKTENNFSTNRNLKLQDSCQRDISQDELADKANQFAADIKQVLKEELGVTEEQIEEAMAVLGLSFADLMNPNQLSSLVAELTGAEDMGVLLCSEAFVNVLKEAGVLSEKLLDELGLTSEEFTEMLDASQISAEEPAAELELEPVGEPQISAEELTEESQVPEEKLTEEAQIPVEKPAEESQTSNEKLAGESQVPEEKLPEEKLTEEPQMQAEKPLEAEGQPQPTSAKVFAETEAEDTPHSLLVHEKVQETEEPDEEVMAELSKDALETVEDNTNNTDAFTKQQGQQSMGNADTQTENQVADIVNYNASEASFSQLQEEAAAGASQVDVADIIRQITEYSKAVIGHQTATIQMQLNPENLGKIYMEVTSKNGQVSAHITAQNEVVKEALENQLIELRQNLNQAGIKVEAVEVTVGNHEFERNLEQDAKRQEEQAAEQERALKKTRQINLSDLAELGGLMSEEENLVAQMMAEQGNSIDYMI